MNLRTGCTVEDDMTATTTACIALAITLFWSVGAYNRLVRLRAKTKARFVLLDGHLSQMITIVVDHLKIHSSPPFAQEDTGSVGPNAATAMAGMQGASTQFDASLKVGRSQPLDPGAMAALQTALVTLQMSWERMHEERLHFHELPPALTDQAWAGNMQLITHASSEFNRAVLAYNAAVRQFPAVVLAYLCGFRPAGCI